jgi:hypothetical protein
VQAVRRVNQKASVAAVVVVVLALVAFGLYRHFRLPEASDDAVVGFVYEVLLEGAQEGLRSCEFSMASGMVLVKTTEEAVVVSEWRDSATSVLSPTQRSCLAAHLVGLSGKPPGVTLVPGREYELDVSLAVPQTGLQ